MFVYQALYPRHNYSYYLQNSIHLFGVSTIIKKNTFCIFPKGFALQSWIDSLLQAFVDFYN